MVLPNHALATIPREPDFTIAFDAAVEAEKVKVVLLALADFYRACGGAGFRTMDFASENSESSLAAIPSEPDFTMTFDAGVESDKVKAVLLTLVDFYRACGGVGLRTIDEEIGADSRLGAGTQADI